jgi:hypothetical protein
MSDAFAMAHRLREVPDDALRELLRARRTPPARIGDFFDLAESLLDDASVGRALTSQDRDTLAALAATTRGADTVASIATATGRSIDVVRSALRAAERLFLATIDDSDDSGAHARVSVVAAVANVFASWPAQKLPTVDELIAPPAPDFHRPEPLDPASADRVSAERATLGVGVLGESLHELGRDPARQLGRGAPSMPDLKRMAAAANSTVDQVELILGTAAQAGLTLVLGGYIRVSEAGEEWLASTLPARWRFLAEAWLQTVPETFRDRAVDAYRSGSTDLSAELAWWYPAGGETLRTAVETVRTAGELLGVSVEGTTSTPGKLLLEGDVVGSEQALAALLPPEVDQVVLQDDLTVIALGPPEATLDRRLRLMADPEGRAQASRYRFTSTSVSRALAAGETAESLLAFLASVSLTGIPQPLSYLVTESEQRFGRVRVGTIGAVGDGSVEAGRVSYVRSDDAGVIGAVSVDQSLAPLGLRHTDEHRLTSRLPPETVYWALHDAKYPVVAEDEHGEPLQVKRQPPARRADVEPAAPEPDLVARLRAGDAGDTSRAWLTKQLEIAVRDHTPVTVSVVFGERQATYTIEPTSLSAGRLRGLDRSADVERTLPLSTITEVLAAV